MSPRRSPRPCRVPTCPNLDCDQHKRERNRQYEGSRGSATARGYDAAWRERRAAFLAAHPVCELRLPGCTERASVVDHRIPKSQGGADHPSNYQSACAPCHNRKTASEDGGFGNARKTQGY